MGKGFPKLKVRDQTLEGQKIRSLGQHHIVLQKQAHANGRYECGQPRRISQRFVGDFLYGKAVRTGIDDGKYKRKDNDYRKVPPPHSQNRGDDQSGHGTDHIDFSMGEINQLNDAVYHGVSQSDQGVNTASGQAAQEQFKKYIGDIRISLTAKKPTTPVPDRPSNILIQRMMFYPERLWVKANQRVKNRSPNPLWT